MSKEELIALIRMLSAVETLLSMSSERHKVPDHIWEQIESFTEKASRELNNPQAKVAP